MKKKWNGIKTKGSTMRLLLILSSLFLLIASEATYAKSVEIKPHTVSILKEVFEREPNGNINISVVPLELTTQDRLLLNLEHYKKPGFGASVVNFVSYVFFYGDEGSGVTLNTTIAQYSPSPDNHSFSVGSAEYKFKFKKGKPVGVSYKFTRDNTAKQCWLKDKTYYENISHLAIPLEEIKDISIICEQEFLAQPLPPSVLINSTLHARTEFEFLSSPNEIYTEGTEIGFYNTDFKKIIAYLKAKRSEVVDGIELRAEDPKVLFDTTIKTRKLGEKTIVINARCEAVLRNNRELQIALDILAINCAPKDANNKVHTDDPSLYGLNLVLSSKTFIASPYRSREVKHLPDGSWSLEGQGRNPLELAVPSRANVDFGL